MLSFRQRINNRELKKQKKHQQKTNKVNNNWNHVSHSAVNATNKTKQKRSRTISVVIYRRILFGFHFLLNENKH